MPSPWAPSGTAANVLGSLRTAAINVRDVGADGCWVVDVPPLPAGAGAHAVTIANRPTRAIAICRSCRLGCMCASSLGVDLDCTLTCYDSLAPSMTAERAPGVAA